MRFVFSKQEHLLRNLIILEPKSISNIPFIYFLFFVSPGRWGSCWGCNGDNREEWGRGDSWRKVALEKEFFCGGVGSQKEI